MCRHALAITARYSDISSLHTFRTWFVILSSPGAFLPGSDWITSAIAAPVTSLLMYRLSGQGPVWPQPPLGMSKRSAWAGGEKKRSARIVAFSAFASMYGSASDLRRAGRWGPSLGFPARPLAHLDSFQ